MLGVDATLLLLALLLALWVRMGMIWFPPDPLDQAMLYLSIAISLFFFVRRGLYRSIIRYMGQQAIFAVLEVVTISALVLAVTAFVFGGFMPRSVPIIYWCFAYLFIGGSRLLIRAYYHKGVQIHKERVAIYGAGTSGLQVYKALLHGIEYKPVVFFDDNVAKQGMLIDGMLVYGTHEMEAILDKFKASKVLLAMPSVSLHRRREIIQDLRNRNINVHMVPGLEDLLDSTLKGDSVAHVYENVLGRDPVQPDTTLLKQCIEDKVVMVTGAGGSIGAELCRQILLNSPKKLVLFELSEFALYTIEKELLEEEFFEKLGAIEIVPLLGSVQDQKLLERTINAYQVETIYHAAAYKHVPMVEHNIIEGIRNNIFGTLALVRAAVDCKVENFVLISTDKAVRPTSIMGATKRCAEIICQAYSRHFETRFCMVRFGNVLGSSGSVIPLFFEQINAGGPVTITHPEVSRYFMTLHEAAQLVLQAGSMGKGGDIFVLEMGEPVRIMDLATRMIDLMGYRVKDSNNPDGDIEIRVIGMRPGEKLHEELLLGENVTGTNHPMILRAEESGAELINLESYIEKLREACEDGDCRAVMHLLREFIPEFRPDSGISDKLWLTTHHDRVLPGDDRSGFSNGNVKPLVRSKPKA